MPRWCFLLALAACGRVGFAPIGGGGGDGGNGLPGSDGGHPGGDSAVTADALMVPMCGSTVIVHDDFTTGSPGAGWGQWVSSGAINIASQAGNAHITIAANTANGSFGDLRQNQSEAFAGVCAIVELVQPPGSAGALAYVRLGTDTKYMQMYVQNGQLWGSFDDNGTSGTVGPAAYDAANDRFLRIRVVGNSYFFEAGPSLTSFPTSLGNEGGTAIDPSPSYMQLGVDVTAAGVSATSVDFGMALLLGA